MRRWLCGVRGAAIGLLATCAIDRQALPAAPTAERAIGADSVRVPAGLGVPSAQVARVDGVAVVAASELARLLGATEFWRPDVRKLVLRLGPHRLTFTADDPFIVIDDHTVRLEHLVVPRSGELQIPVDVARVLAREGWPRLAYDADARQMRVAPGAGFVGPPRIVVTGGLTTLTVPTEHPDAVTVLSRSRARFRLHVAGGLAGALADSIPDNALVRDLAVSPVPGGLTFELALAPTAEGWRLERDAGAGRVRLLFTSAREGFEEFATEGAPGPRVLRTIVLDPGHGGSDIGASVEGSDEKTLALVLARLVTEELGRRAAARVVLTREDDRDMTQVERAEVANRARADAVVSLHFEAMPEFQARGTVAWCTPAVVSAGREADLRSAELVTLRPWREASAERAVESRGLAESITSMLERRGFGPATVRERLPVPLMGVHPPGVLLDCGTLSNPDERARLLSPRGLQALAAAIAEGLVSWQRNE